MRGIKEDQVILHDLSASDDILRREKGAML
jgi:hypothetical protein